MPGLYEIITRAPGTLITALIYNSDHQAHIDGRSAELMQSLGASLSQMNLVDDPYPLVGTPPMNQPSFAPSLAGEITRLRHEIADLKSFLAGDVPVNWYAPITGAGVLTVGARVQRLTSLSILDSTATKINFTDGTATFNNPLTSPGPVWNNSVNQTRFTAPYDGLYYAFASIAWQSVGSLILNKTRRLQIGVNNSFTANPVVNDNVHTSLPADVHYQTITGFLDLTATDYVEYRVFQDNGSPLNLIGDSQGSIVGGLIFLGSHP